MYILTTFKNGFFYRFRSNDLNILKKQAAGEQWEGARITDIDGAELFAVGV